jgi:aryl-alcohol dehydrogenase-like predicted oxidoreductase
MLFLNVMNKRLLGRTGRNVSEIGLGGYCFKSREKAAEADRVIHRAVELGVNLIDTAPGYGDSEEVIGESLATLNRGDIVLSSKYYPYGGEDRLNLSGESLARSVASSLKRLRTGYLDILHLHWVHAPEDAANIINSDLIRTAQRLKSLGSIRHIAISEASELDGEHKMLEVAVPSGAFDVVMVTYNVFLQTAERNVLPLALTHGVGVLVMMPLNQPLGGPGLATAEGARANLDALAREKLLPNDPALSGPDPLGFLCAGTGLNLPQSAIQFALDRPEVSSVLVGTTSVKHLEENLAVTDHAPLSDEIHSRARSLFGSITRQVK